MCDEITQNDIAWACEQIARYSELYPRYETYAKVLKDVLEQAVRGFSPLAIVETRPKSIASFAEKSLRKKCKYRDPVNQLTDLCGGRVITHTNTEVALICDFIEKHFVVDAANSVKISERLRPNEFGYRSVHYVVQFRRNALRGTDADIAIPDILYPDPTGKPPMKAEIQVRTLLEHAWAVFSHERVYKGAFTVPAVWERELAGLAALLEEADQAFSRIQSGLRSYMASYGTYMSPEQTRNEITLLKVVLGCSPGNLDVAYRIARLAMTIEEWDLVIEMLQPHATSLDPSMLRDLGVSLCKRHREDTDGREYKQGQEYLARACELNPADADAWASRAGTYRDDPNARRQYYQRAFVADPTDPYAVSQLLFSEITQTRSVAVVGLVEPSIRASIHRCRSQIEVGTNMPWAYYSLGMFHLLLNEPYASLIAYAKAVQLSTAPWMIETSLRTLEELAPVRNALRGYDWLTRWLALGWRARFDVPSTDKGLARLPRASNKPIAGPVLIVAGGTDASIEHEMPIYRELLMTGLQDFVGTIISGGTRAGVAGLVGDVQEAVGDGVWTIGYVPKLVPAGTQLDPRYREIRSTEGHDFSALEVVQYWIDILLSGIPAHEVCLIGINGGTISAVEYRLALALGAQVVVIEGSGRAAAELFKDRDWATEPNLLPMPADAATLAAIIGAQRVIDDATQRDILGRAIHEAYRQQQADRLANVDPAMADWDHLAKNLQESNLQQADHIAKKLARIGCSICATDEVENPVEVFSAEEVEIMAEMEHGRWIAERLKDGWRYGPQRDVARRISPYLVPWRDLPDSVKEWDRNSVRQIPEFLAKVGLRVRRDRPFGNALVLA